MTIHRGIHSRSRAADTLTLNNGVAASAINVANGSQTISPPISLSNASSISFGNSGAALTISSAMSGAQANFRCRCRYADLHRK